MDSSGIAKAREWEKAEADLGLVFLAIENQIGQALLPVIKELADEIVGLIRNGDLKRWADDAATAFGSLAHAGHDLAIVMSGFTTTPDIGGESLAQLNTGLKNLEETKKHLEAQVAGGGAITDFVMGGAKIADLDSVRSELGQINHEIDVYKDKIASLSKAPVTSASGDPLAGTKSFTAPVAGGRGSSDAERANEQFQKLSASLVEQTSYENALTVAWEQGGKAVQGLVDNQKAYETALRLGKGATDEMRAAIMQKSLAEQEAADRTKAAQKATEDQQRAVRTAGDEFTKISVQLRDHIRLETDLAAAYGQGAAAVQAVIDKDKIRVEVEKLGVAATQEQIAATQQLAAADIQASNLAEAAKLQSENLKTSIDAMGSAFETAFKSALTPGNDLLKTMNDLGQALEDLILKALVFKPLEDKLTAWASSSGSSLFSGAGASAPSTSAPSGSGGWLGFLKSILGSLFSSGSPGAAGAGGGAADGGGLFGSGMSGFGLYHNGGIVGGSAPMRSLPSAAFIGAPRLHEGGKIVGLSAGEVPIIAKLGETVTPAGKSGRGGDRRPHVTVNQYIQTPDAGSFGASSGQLAADAHRHVTSLWDRNS
jgi:hypothetical protein